MVEAGPPATEASPSNAALAGPSPNGGPRKVIRQRVPRARQRASSVTAFSFELRAITCSSVEGDAAGRGSTAIGRFVHTSPHTRQCHQSVPLIDPRRDGRAWAQPQLGFEDPRLNGAFDSFVRSIQIGTPDYAKSNGSRVRKKAPRYNGAPQTRHAGS